MTVRGSGRDVPGRFAGVHVLFVFSCWYSSVQRRFKSSTALKQRHAVSGLVFLTKPRDGLFPVWNFQGVGLENKKFFRC